MQTTNITKDKRTNISVTTIDKVFLLSDDEFKQYFNCTEDDLCKTTASKFTDYALTKPQIYGNSQCSYYLRTSRIENIYEGSKNKSKSKLCQFVDDVNDNEDGTFYMNCYPTWGGCDVNLNGVRPVIWVKYDINVKSDTLNILDVADDLGITNDVIKEGVKMGTDLIPMPKPIGIIKDKAIDAVGDKIIDALRGK